MSKIVSIWSGLGEDEEDANTVHDEKLVIASLVRNEPTARNADQIEDCPFQEVEPINGKQMTLYDLPEGHSTEDFDARIRASLGEVPDNAHLNARCYQQISRWDGEYWRDGTMR